MNYRTISLKVLIDEFGKKKAFELLSKFSCPLNNDVEEFVHQKAIPFERAGMARTYLVVAEDSQTSYGICAIYSITTKSISISKEMTNSFRKKAFGTTYAVGNPANTILIGQLAKNYQDGNDQYITGEILMSLIIDYVRKIDILVPSVSVYVECENKECLKKYYEKYGFVNFSTNKDGLLQYIVSTKKFISPEYEKEHIEVEREKQLV